MDWADEASCFGLEPELFFDETDPEAVEVAKEVCAECPVQTECLLYALEGNVRDGIWGGTTPADRKRWRQMIKVRAAA